MRETSYHAVIAEMTVRALWELQNLLDCIPDALFHFSYQRYLENQIRETFGLTGTPIKMITREHGDGAVKAGKV